MQPIVALPLVAGLLPMIGWLLSHTTLAVGVRARLIGRSAIGYGLLFVAALVQMLLGHAPTDPAFAALGIAALGVVFLASPLVHLFTPGSTARLSQAH